MCFYLAVFVVKIKFHVDGIAGGGALILTDINISHHLICCCCCADDWGFRCSLILDIQCLI